MGGPLIESTLDTTGLRDQRSPRYGKILVAYVCKSPRYDFRHGSFDISSSVMQWPMCTSNFIMNPGQFDSTAFARSAKTSQGHGWGAIILLTLSSGRIHTGLPCVEIHVRGFNMPEAGRLKCPES